MFEEDLRGRAAELLETYRALGLRLATAESCTGGLVAALLTEIPGSSAVVDCGFVAYSNSAKQALLGVSSDLLDRHGAVSPQVAEAMVRGALARASADVAVSITGIAGPDGGTVAKPVGLVHFGALRQGGNRVHVERRYGAIGRTAIRRAALLEALSLFEDQARTE
ncbi:MAG: CinA family protein [Methylobacteriaceae bacterium]|nr:CinA family protein [Methylobacteriaceae bacterium]